MADDNSSACPTLQPHEFMADNDKSEHGMTGLNFSRPQSRAQSAASNICKKTEFTQMDMFKSKALVKEEHNMPGYFVPQIPFDPIRHKDEKEQFQYNIGKKKRPGTSKLDMKSDKK